VSRAQAAPATLPGVTPFRIAHEFRCPSLELYWRVYFDDSHVANLDEQTGVDVRTLVERREDDDTVFRHLEIKPKRQLPAFLRKLVKRELGFSQKETFFKRENRIEMEVIPTIFPGRSEIKSVYTAEMVGPDKLVRAYEGTISIKVPIAGRKVEKAILEDMIRSYEVGTQVTQKRLDVEAAK